MTKRRSTIEDVAALAGVSIKTVSRVVNREPNVRQATREKVEAAIKSLEYRPNPSARNLASHHSRVILLVYYDPSKCSYPNPDYIVKLQEGVLNACRPQGFDLLIHPYSVDDDNASAMLRERILQIDPTGIVLSTPLSSDADIVSVIEETNTPFVLMSIGAKKSDDSGKIIGTNDRNFSSEMTCHLAALGHTRIAFIKGDPVYAVYDDMFDGYKEGLERSKLQFDPDLVLAGEESVEAGIRCAEQLLQIPNRPTAIFSANDELAAGVLQVSSRMGISVPEELSVAGSGDHAIARSISPTLTTVALPIKSMAESAALALVDGARGGPGIVDPAIVPATIIVRESTGPVPSKS